MRIPINLAKVGFTLIHMFVFLERGIATLFPSKYEGFNSKSVGILMSILMVRSRVKFIKKITLLVADYRRLERLGLLQRAMGHLEILLRPD